MQDQVAGLRRFGAAALDLAWVAAGRLDGYWERQIKPWDMAAGLILVREAGGYVSDCEGGDDMLAKAASCRQRDHAEGAAAGAEGGRASSEVPLPAGALARGGKGQEHPNLNSIHVLFCNSAV